MELYGCKYCNKIMNIGALSKHEPICKQIYNNIELIKRDFLNGISVNEISKIYGLNKNNITSVLLQLGIKMRSKSDASKLIHKRNPEIFKHTEQTKQILRTKRIEWMKLNPLNTAWRTRNEPSYPEKLFMQICKETKLCDSYDIVREYCVFPYFIDFAFVNAKVAIEIDGSQHWLDITRIENDKLKDRCLIEHGWRIMRIPEFKIKSEYKTIISDVVNFLSNNTVSEKIYTNEIIVYETVKNIKNNHKVIKQELARKQAESILNIRSNDFYSVYPSRGWSVILGNIWGISSQKAAKYSKKYFIKTH